MAGYAVRCECGREQAVSGVDAGGEVACGCGRRVPVPSLSRLRAAAGEPTASPELLVRAELLAGTLPAEGDCVGCGSPHAAVYRVSVVCETVSQKAGQSSGLIGELFEVLARVFASDVMRLVPRLDHGGHEGPRDIGRDVQFDLPVRACPACVRAVPARTLLGATPLYARLLEKYPDAAVGRAVG